MPEAVEAMTTLITLGEIAERLVKATLGMTAQIKVAVSMDAMECLSIADPVVATQGHTGECANPQ